jgi:hypothetical protein
MSQRVKRDGRHGRNLSWMGRESTLPSAKRLCVTCALTRPLCLLAKLALSHKLILERANLLLQLIALLAQESIAYDVRQAILPSFQFLV